MADVRLAGSWSVLYFTLLTYNLTSRMADVRLAGSSGLWDHTAYEMYFECPDNNIFMSLSGQNIRLASYLLNGIIRLAGQPFLWFTSQTSGWFTTVSFFLNMQPSKTSFVHRWSQLMAKYVLLSQLTAQKIMICLTVVSINSQIYTIVSINCPQKS